MGETFRNSFSFGEFVLDPNQKLLLRNGEIVKLPAKTFELLAYLINNPNRVINKTEIMEAVWQGSLVEDANLSVHISNLRKIFGNGNGEKENANPVGIETFPKVGYRFVGDVVEFERQENEGVITAASAEEPTHETSNFEANKGKDPKRTGRIVKTSVLISAGAVMIAVASYFLASGFRWPLKGEQTMVPVAGMERTVAYALSPNGEYVAHAPSIDGQSALFLTHVTSNSRVQLIPPGQSAYLAMEFSGDGNWLFFLRAEMNTTVLYKIPILGTSPVRLFDDLGIHFSLSATDDRVCFRRKTETGETAMLIARTDGSEARTIATRSPSDPYSDFSFGLSPDGSKFASIVGGKVISVDVETGAETVIATLAPSGLGDGLKWLRDGSGLIASTSEKSGLPSQLWLVDHPSGSVSRITNDLSAYGRVDVSADGGTVVSARYEDVSRLWIAPLPYDSFTPVSTTYRHGFNWIRWGPADKVVFGSNSSGNRDVWIMDRNGGNELQITQNAGNNIMPVSSPDGRYLIFASNRNDGNFNLWRVNFDGNDQIRLTKGQSENQPAVSPDGQWVYYTSGKVDGSPEERTVWRVSIDGEDEKQVVALPSYGADVSPDGKTIACWIKPNSDSPWKIGIVPADGQDPIKLFDAERGQPVKWTADGKAIAYVRTIKGVSNVWLQPINGTAPRQATALTSERILQFDLSPNNELIASRTERRSDIVMIKNFR